MTEETIKSIYVEQNRVDEYFTYIRKNTKISISDFEQDSTIYLAAEDRYMSGEYAQAAVALDNYLKRYPNGLFSQKASYYAADSYQRTMHPDKALPHYLAVIATPRSRYTEDALLNAAGISYDQKNFVLADSLYRMLAQQAEADGNRIIGKLGVLRCSVQLGKADEVDNAASDLLSESRITAEHRDEALISRARMSYNAQMHQTALERYATLLNSANGEYSGEAAYRRAEIYYITEQVSLAEKEINILKESAEEFAKLSAELKQDFEKMVSDRESLLADINSLVDKYQEIDNDINRSELELKYECNAKLLEARKLFESEHSRRKQKLNLLDIMKDDSEDIFKTKE